jgi:type VI protein secretion system component VasF
MNEEARRWSADSLEGMPPRKRRLIVWALFWLFPLGMITGWILRWIGLPPLAASLSFAALTAAIFIPLGRAACLELRQRRAEGLEPPPRPVTRKAFIIAVVLIILMWIGYGLLMASDPRPVFPFLPVLITGYVAFLGWCRHTQKQAGSQPH